MIIDAGPLIALFDKKDNLHGVAKETLRKIKSQMITTWPAITEVMYVLDFSFNNQQLFLEYVESGAIEISAVGSEEIVNIQKILATYADVPLDFADASLMSLANRRKINSVFTFDHKHFLIFKPDFCPALKLFPSTIL